MNTGAPASVTGVRPWHALLLGLTAATIGGCHALTEIVLVVDTDMEIPADVAQFVVTVEGATEMHMPLPVDLMVPGNLPATLGLLPATNGSDAPLSVTVEAYSQEGPRVLMQTAQTRFVPNERRMLRMVLSVSCLPVTCDADQTCQNGACVSIDQPAGSLSAWTGTVPDRPSRPSIIPVVGQSVWASGWHSAATEGTTLYAWGENQEGQLGTGNTQNGRIRRAVMKVQAPMSVGLGQKHSCICDGRNQAYCWGLNHDGELGLGNTSSPHMLPTAVPGVNDCMQIAGGDLHTCAIRNGGTVSCWGKNSYGQVGQTAGASVLAPVSVPGLAGIVQLGGGDGYTCALRDDKMVLCWGYNNSGQLGDGTMSAHAIPALVNGMNDVAEIAVGRTHACARQTSGMVWCWGGGSSGQLGNGTSTLFAVTPVLVTGLTDATQVVAGHMHSCALSKSTGVSCWGANNLGQLGVGTADSSNVPIHVPDLFEVTSLAGGSEHNCARHTDTKVSCWGANDVNQLGDGTTTNRKTPVTVAGF